MFNEESFIYREPPTLNQRLGRRATIYHEVAHHWFGDDVTMKWFDDLWLKEGFATYMAAKMQDIEAKSDPARAREPNPWMSFYLRNKPAAYDVDQTSGTTPVWQQLAQPRPGQEQLRRDRLQQGAGHSEAAQLSRRRLGLPRRCARFPRLARLRQRDVAGPAGVDRQARRTAPLADWGRQYILRPGMPVLEQQIDVASGKIRRLALIQHPAQELSGSGVWPMRTEVALWSRRRARQIDPGRDSRRDDGRRRGGRTAGAGLRVRERERQRLRPRHARRAEHARGLARTSAT